MIKSPDSYVISVILGGFIIPVQLYANIYQSRKKKHQQVFENVLKMYPSVNQRDPSHNKLFR